jgi:hypothetical protein
MSQRINYIKNPSFKAGSSDFWSALGSGVVVSSETDTALFGEYSLRVQKASGIFDCGAKISGYRIPVTVGSTYTASAYIRMSEELESRTYTCKIDWYNASTGGSIVSSIENSVEIFNYQVSGLGFISVYATGVAPAGSTYAEISIYQEEKEDDASAEPFKFFYIDSVMFEETAYIKGFFESITQGDETTSVNNALKPIPYPEITGMELNADITLNGLIFNTIDEDGVLWVCTDLQGWWGNSEPEVANITRGLGDGSYDVRGRYAAREIEFSGVFFPPNKSLVSKAREKLIAAIDLVKTNGWLIVDEEPPRASLVRLVDRPEIVTVNSRGRTEFTFTLRAHDPIKYEWVDGYQDGRKLQEIQMNSSSTISNDGNSIVPAVFQMHGPMEVGSFIRNLANQQTLTLAQRLRGSNETTGIIGVFREDGVATLRTNTSSNILVGDYITVTGVDKPSFNTASALVTSIIDDEIGENFQVGYINEGEDFIRLFITSKSFSNNVATLIVTPDAPNTIYTTNTSVVVSGVGGLFNGVQVLTSAVNNTITYTKAVSATSITKAFRINNVATITTNTSLGVLVGDNISVSSEIGTNFNTASQAVLSVIDNTTTNTYSISYTNNFTDFGKSQIIQKSIGTVAANVASLTVTPNYLPAPVNVNAVAKLDVNGAVDTSFASNIGTGVSTDNLGVLASALQSDGKILLGGEFSSWNGTSAGRVVRLNSTGTLDGTFNINVGANASVSAIAVQSNSQVLVGGAFTSWAGVGSNRNRLVRLNSDGLIDETFAANANTGANNNVAAIAVQSDQKIVVGGNFTTWNAVTVNAIVRLNTNGTSDTTFTTNTSAGVGGTVAAIAVQSDQKIVVGGEFTSFNGVTVGNVVRLNSDGTRDTTFTTGNGTGANNVISSVTVQSDAKIILAGSFTTWNTASVIRIVRLNSDGTIDTSFSTNVATGPDSSVLSVGLQSDGKIIVGGLFTTWGGTTVGRIVRLNSDGTRDTTFNPGVGVAGTTGNEVSIRSDIILADDKIIITGRFRTGPSFFVSSDVVVSGVDATFNGVYTLLAPTTNAAANTITYAKIGSVSPTPVTSATALVEYSAPAGSVVALSGATTVNSANAYVEYATLENAIEGNPLVGLVDGDILEVDTYHQEVALNGVVSGKRFYLETLADWITLNKGSNSLQLSYLENPVVEKSIASDVATIKTSQANNFRVGDSVKIQGVDATFDGIVTITAINSTTSFSFSKANADIEATVVNSADAVVANVDAHMVVYYRSGWLG